MSEKHAELPIQQSEFCVYYVGGFISDKGEDIKPWNATQSYLKAYPDSTYESAKANGSRLITNDNVKGYIESVQSEVLKIAGISKLSMIKKLLKISDDAEQEKDQIKAIEVINKMTGMNEPEKTEVTERFTIVKAEKSKDDL